MGRVEAHSKTLLRTDVSAQQREEASRGSTFSRARPFSPNDVRRAEAAGQTRYLGTVRSTRRDACPTLPEMYGFPPLGAGRVASSNSMKVTQSSLPFSG